MNWPRLPAFALPRDQRAFIALLASIAGSMALTTLVSAIVGILWLAAWPVTTSEARIALIGKAMILAEAGSIVVLISLGLAINKRTVKLSKDGLEASGGDDAAPPAAVTTTITTTEVPAP